MAKIKLPPKARLIQLLRYEPDTGLLFWLPRPREEFSDARAFNTWNTRYSGKPALMRVNQNGYRCGTIEGVSLLAHRIIWKMMTGRDPNEVDHSDGCRTNNVWSNLRDVTAQGNRRNQGRSGRNRSGVLGVVWYQRWEGSPGSWWVRIGGKTLGYFDSLEEAVSIRKAAEKQRGYHKNHGQRLAARNTHPLNSISKEIQNG